MPPRFAYWTIIFGGQPTAFRSATRDELLPTFKQIQSKHPDAQLRYFARGKLWYSDEEAHAALVRERFERHPRREDRPFRDRSFRGDRPPQHGDRPPRPDRPRDDRPRPDRPRDDRPRDDRPRDDRPRDDRPRDDRRPPAAGWKPRPDSRKPGGWKPRSDFHKQEAGSRKPGAGGWKPRSDFRKPDAGSRKPEAGSRKPNAAGGHRGRDWRPGGGHKDPRDRFKVPRDVKRARMAKKFGWKKKDEDK
jgi:hypothetical protein